MTTFTDLTTQMSASADALADQIAGKKAEIIAAQNQLDALTAKRDGIVAAVTALGAVSAHAETIDGFLNIAPGTAVAVDGVHPAYKGV
jgi:Tfp pilus assembly protein FimV